MNAVSAAHRRPLQERFWEKVKKGAALECWEWTAGCFADGYGAINVFGKPQRAHRISYELNVGPLSDGLEVLHSCDNKKCINPMHLRLGSHAENMADMAKRSRSNPTYKVTDDQVSQIRESTESLADIAEKFGISIGLVGAIRGKKGHRVKRPVAMSRRKELSLQKKLKVS